MVSIITLTHIAICYSLKKTQMKHPISIESGAILDQFFSQSGSHISSFKSGALMNMMEKVNNLILGIAVFLFV